MKTITPEGLRKVESLENLPQESLQWILDHSEVVTIPAGGTVFSPNTEVLDMKIVLAGRIRNTFQQGSGEREVGITEAGNITGVLPYSRLKTAAGRGTAIDDVVFLSLPKSKFPDMIREQQPLVEALVHLMTNRVRTFTSYQQQNEKLLSLGKLSAGLAHELNNPASAVVRSASELKKHLTTTPESFKRVISMKLSDVQIDAVNDMLFSKAQLGKHAECSLMERTALVDDLLDWLEDHEVENADDAAEIFLEYGIGVEELEMVLDEVSGKFLSPVIGWLVNVFTTEKMVIEIQEAAQRISDLVQSIKTYSYMDHSQAKEKVSVHHGLNSTITMLTHKIRKNQVELSREYAANLPEISAFGGELNQVWTNLIDNALDALEGRKGKLTLQTRQDREFVLVNIIDNGPGIPEDVVQRIFDPFFTTKEIGKGTGLGLDVVLKIVQRHNGTIKVNSVPGNTNFEVCLPI
ncbi:MAG: GHKL domain-containing protein [Bacteroidia bacterium]|nr:GHKL domain-containing protein [Bacteroidia bacterium]